MGLSEVRSNSLEYREDLTLADLAENEETIRNVRLWDPAILKHTYQRLQEVRGFYQFNDVDVDRYEIDGRLTQVVLSARDGLPSQSWENRHLAYTHGYRAVLSPANAVTADGQPDFLVKDVFQERYEEGRRFLEQARQAMAGSASTPSQAGPNGQAPERRPPG